MRGHVSRWLTSAVVIAVLLAFIPMGYAQQKLKVGFIYVGPIGDYGWTNAHDVARRLVEQQLPVETLYVESVPEGRVEPFIDRLVAQGAKVIFTTSFGFMDGTVAAAQRYPNAIFAHASGFKRARNLATYMADFYQVYYLNGLMAGALTKTNKVGYVGAFPIPEVKRHLDAYALGARAVNPQATIQVRWLQDWFSPPKAKEATQALIADGVDVFAFTEDTPTVIQESAKKNLLSFAHYSPMYKFAPKNVVSGELVHWETIYLDFLRKVLAGKYTAEKAVEVGAQPGMMTNPVFVSRLKAATVKTADLGTLSVYDLVQRRVAQMSKNPVAFDPFAGPIKDRKGVVRVPAGHTLTEAELTTMEWSAPGVVGPWPGEP